MWQLDGRCQATDWYEQGYAVRLFETIYNMSVSYVLGDFLNLELNAVRLLERGGKYCSAGSKPVVVLELC